MRYRIALAACIVALALPAHAQDATDAQLAELNYQIRMLRASVKNLQDQNAKLQQEINTLRAENAAPVEPSPDEPVAKDQEAKDDGPVTFDSVKAIIAAMPADLQPHRGKPWDNITRSLADDWIAEHVPGARLITIIRFECARPSGQRIQVAGACQPFQVNGIPYTAGADGWLDKAKWAKRITNLQRRREKGEPGSKILFTGTIEEIRLQVRNDAWMNKGTVRNTGISIGLTLTDCSLARPTPPAKDEPTPKSP